MSFADKVKNKVNELRGRGKASAGQATGNHDLRAEGRGEQSVADLRQAGEKVKDSFRR
ncbi:CsbD family protein [Frankia sp. AgKG'84/4]|uniref:CsbD family protein n=1 Tax=Frankia sp. AgKG'84/4 TaxID=573490 RepID=UPI00200F5E21|nr:CsbD family protein [Frankia sp. AgKG'84/4]MCL9794676.1 CsbD family protein [Frankia sp. AgKG'84/4]